MRRAPLLFMTGAVIAACSPSQGGPGGSGTGGAISFGTGGGAPSGTGGGTVIATGGSSPGTGGGAVAGTGGRGGSPSTGAGGTAARGTGGLAAGGRGIDDGNLFTDAGVPPASSGGAMGTDAAVGTAGDAQSDGPPGNGHTATCSIPAVGLTAVFTQTGTDVTVVITATACPAGSHVIQIHAGFSCDSAATRGGVWGGKRGDGIGGTASTITCNSSMRGTLTYTRPGTDPATNWTVGDHNTLTDVTLHPMMLDTSCGTFF